MPLSMKTLNGNKMAFRLVTLVLLLLFIVIQRFLTIRREKRKVALPVESIHKEG